MYVRVAATTRLTAVADLQVLPATVMRAANNRPVNATAYWIDCTASLDTHRATALFWWSIALGTEVVHNCAAAHQGSAQRTSCSSLL